LLFSVLADRTNRRAYDSVASVGVGVSRLYGMYCGYTVRPSAKVNIGSL